MSVGLHTNSIFIEKFQKAAFAEKTQCSWEGVRTVFRNTYATHYTFSLHSPTLYTRRIIMVRAVVHSTIPPSCFPGIRRAIAILRSHHTTMRLYWLGLGRALRNHPQKHKFRSILLQTPSAHPSPARPVQGGIQAAGFGQEIQKQVVRNVGIAHFLALYISAKRLNGCTPSRS